MATKKEHKEEQIEALIDKAVSDTVEDSAEALSTKQPTENSKNKIDKKVKTDKRQPKKKKASIRDLIDGSILTREYVIDQMPYIFFLALIAMIYIGNKYDSEKMARDAVVIQNQIKELRCEKISIHSELDSLSKQSSVTKLINEKKLSIKQLVEPPKKIVIPNKKNSGKTNLTANK